MARGFLSTVNWTQTAILGAERVLASSIVLTLLGLGGVFFPQEPAIKAFLMMPLVIAAFMFCAFFASLMAKVELPVMGLVAAVLSLAVVAGDPLVWVLKKIAPKLVPIEDFRLFNPQFIYVVNDRSAEF